MNPKLSRSRQERVDRSILKQKSLCLLCDQKMVLASKEEVK